MRQNHLRDFGVERDYLALGESALGEVNLVHIRDCQLAAFDFDELLLRHWDYLRVFECFVTNFWITSKIRLSALSCISPLAFE